mgnify:CR=1 FL=1
METAQSIYTRLKEADNKVLWAFAQELHTANNKLDKVTKKYITLYDYNLLWFNNWNHGMKDQPVCHGESKKPFYTTILDVINY